MRARARWCAALAVFGVAVAAGVWVALRPDGRTSLSTVAPSVQADPAAEDAPVLAQLEPDVAADAIESEGAAETELLAPAAPTDARRAVSARSPRPAALVGRVVDAHSGEGLPCIQMTLNRLGETSAQPQLTDLDGRFRLAPWSSDRMSLQLEDALTGKGVGYVSITPSSADGSGADGLVLPVEVGPTVIVRLIDAPQDLSTWRIALSERTSRSSELRWRDARRWSSEGEWIARYRRVEFGVDNERVLALRRRQRKLGGCRKRPGHFRSAAC